ncbi:hypothetical protein CF8_0128 [Nocardioides sp. CF8]|uniref:hypothetical protein n=1 Tax=Nocardioides sp. CF8 TaxID=110319 RepID=UPI00032E5DC8|nr:hypothetical protein [Nocardioides sp. CF8]EON25684.1 hypothetical protein CF8_0128 [Nocardioides sp. CF8]
MSTPPHAQTPGGRRISEAAVEADKYHQMLALADFFDASGAEMRERARLGGAILADPDVADSAELSEATHAQAEEDIRAATTGKHGLLTRSVELDADALVVRATVLTYQWIDELQAAAFKTLGSIAGRAIGYLAPEVALGGAIVSAGLIETDSLDRDGVAAYLNELADSHPELMEHLTDGGGLLEGLQMRSLLTAGVMSSESGAAAARGGLRAIGVEPFPTDAASALRDAAAGFAEIPADPAGEPAADAALPASIEDLMVKLTTADRRISVQRIGAGRYIAYLPGNKAHEGGRLRLVGNDNTTYVRQVVRAIEQAVDGEPGARVMLVGSSYGGAAAAEIASAAASPAFVVDQVVTAGAPSAQVPSIPEETRVLSLEDRADPVALLGSLINADVANRVTVVYDGADAGEQPYVAGGRAADSAQHPGLRAEIRRITELGYLAG